MADIKITSEQLQALLDQVALVKSDKDDGDAKTSAANAAGTARASAQSALTAATTAESQAILDEQSADHKTTTDLAALDTMIQALLAPPAPAPAQP